MAIRMVRLGSRRDKNEGPRLGTVRRPPRGVKKADYARLDFFDAWLPQLAPSSALMHWFKSRPDSDAAWRTFAAKYGREMAAPDNSRLLDVLATLSTHTDFSVGCYCENERRCHRSILRRLLKCRGAAVVD